MTCFVATLTEFLEKLLPGLASGSVTALGTVYSYLKGIKDKILEVEKKLADLEKRVGSTDSDTGRKSGILGMATDAIAGLSSIRKDLEKLQEEIEGEDKRRTNPGFSSQDFSLFEDRILKSIQEKTPSSHPPSKEVKALEEKIRALEGQLQRLGERVERCQTQEQANTERFQKEQVIQDILSKVGKIQGSLEIFHNILEKISKIR